MYYVVPKNNWVRIVIKSDLKKSGIIYERSRVNFSVYMIQDVYEQ